MHLKHILLGTNTLWTLINANTAKPTVIHDPRYALLDESPAGEGPGTMVRKVRRLADSQILAAKFFDPSEESQEQILHREFFFGHMVEHENIARTIEIVDGSPSPCIIMEYFPMEMLTVLVSNKLLVSQIDSLFKQIATGVAHIHSLGVAHRDLKMDNVLLNEYGTAKIIDFGRASFGRHMVSGDVELAYGLWGSQPFSAPECHEERKYDPIMADVWSLGVLYISMVLSDLPWDSATTDDSAFAYYFDSGIKGREALMSLISLESRSLISDMLSVDPNRRPDMGQVLTDPWIRSIRI
ncbi:MAG: hypothetical protein Q9227_002952 [Pyrenula ochraceoflavens]